MKTTLTAAALAFFASSASAAVLPSSTITTTIPDQNNTVSSWGAGPATEIFGQSFTLGAATSLDFVDFMINDTGAAMNFNAYLFAWDGQNTTGSALYSGTGSTTGTNGLAIVSINTATTLAAGSYIAYLEATSPGFAAFGSVWGSDAYAGGEFLYQDTGGQVNGRVSTPWVGDHQGPNWDLAFALRTSDTVAPVPVPAGLPLLALGLGTLGLIRRKSA